eukprot:403374756
MVDHYISNQLSEYARIEDKFDAQNISDDDLDDKCIHFYLITTKQEQKTAFRLKFRNLPSLKDPVIKMDRLQDGNIFHVLVQLPTQDLRTITDLKYSFIKTGTSGEDQVETGESEQERTKAKKFLKLNSFFDIYQNKKQIINSLIINQKKEYYDALIRFFFNNYEDKEKHYGVPQIFNEFQDFINCEGGSYPISPTLKILTEYYLNVADDVEINLYMFELLSYFDGKILLKKSDSLKSLLQRMIELPFGFLRKIILDTKDLINHERILKGFKNLIQLEALIGLEFFDNINVISDQKKFLNKQLSLKDEFRFNKFKDIIRNARTSNTYNDQSVQLLIYHALMESKSLDNFLTNVEYLEKFATSNVIQDACKDIKQRQNKNYNYSAFIKQYLERLLVIPQFKMVFAQEIRDCIDINLKNNFNSPYFPQLLLDNPDLLTHSFLDKLVHHSKNFYLQANYMELMVKHIPMRKQQRPFKDIKSLITQNFYFQLFSCKNIPEQYQVLSKQIDYINNPVFEMIDKFDKEYLYKTMKQHMFTVFRQQYAIQWMLDTLIRVRNNPDEQIFKVKLLSEVIHDVIKEHTMDNTNIKTIIKMLFPRPQYRLTFKEFKDIADIALNGLGKLIEKERRNLYEDDLVLCAIKIGQNYQENEVIVKIRSIVIEFIKKLRDETITLREVNQTIVANKKNLKEIILLFDPDFDLNQLEELKKINQIFKHQIEIHQIYLLWASKSFLNVSIKNYQSKLDKIILAQEQQLQARNAKNQDHFVQFQAFKTIDKIYHFRDSKVFENLFHSLPDEIAKNNVHFEENKDLETGVYQIRMEGYDKAVQEYLFGKIVKDHFKNLTEYPQTQIQQQEIWKFWKNIQPDDVQNEIQIIKDFLKLPDLNNFNGSIKTELNDQLEADIKNFTMQELFRVRSEIINYLQIYTGKESNQNLDSSQSLKRMIQFQDQMKNSNPQESLESVSKRVSKITEDFTNIDSYYNINWSHLEEYVRSKDTYEFCIQVSGFEFNSLYEYMDDSAAMNNRTIESISAASTFFDQLYKKIESSNFNEFERLMELLSSELQQQIEKDSDFSGKLVNCLENLQEIKHMTSSSRNASENTLQIIESALENGIFVFQLKHGKFQFFLEIMIKQRSKTEDNKSAIKDEQQNSVNVSSLILQKEKIYQHSSRAKLFIHSKTTSLQRQQQVKVIDKIFTQSVDLCKEIYQFILNLNQYGHLDYQDDQEFFRVPIQRENIVADLQIKYKHLKDQYESLKKSLDIQRKRFYFLNYVPNQLVAQLNYPFQDHQQLEKVVQQLIKSKVFKNYFRIQSDIKDNIQILQELQDFWEKENQINTEQEIEQSLRKDYGYQLQSGRVQHKLVSDNISLIKAVCSIFAISKMYPTFDRVLFCEEQTQLVELQTFVNRSIMYPSGPKASKPYVIANFQKLPFAVQYLCYEYIMSNQGVYDLQNTYFTLYILSIQTPNQTTRLIELLRNSPPYQQYIKDDYMRDYFKYYENIKVVRSPQCGLGKTQFIKQQAIKYHAQILRIPIYGEIQKQKIIKIFEDNLSKIQDGKKFIIHYDVYPCGKEDLNVILFELLILKCLNYQFQEIFSIPSSSGLKVFIEISYGLNEKLTSLFIHDNLKYVEQRWDFASINVKLESNDKFQKVCRYLLALQQKPKKYDPKELLQPKQPLNEIDCQVILRNSFSRMLRNQNYYFVNSFVDFVGDQIRRMEESIFFTQENLERQMTGFLGFQVAKKARKFHREIISQLINLSQRISIVEKFSDIHEPSQNLERRALEEEQANRFRDLEWDIFNHPFIVFNDGGNITPIYKDVKSVPEAVIDYHKNANRHNKQNQQLKLYDDLSQDEFIEKILEICVSDSRREKIRKMKDLKNLVFTLDNFMKLVLIYLRIRNFQPIVLMGETGVGKTSLVEYLAKIIDAEFQVLNIHAGISENYIINFVKNANDIAKCQAGDSIEQRRKIILFFDEINTNENINGLLKEIFIDRHINGQPIQRNICLVAACNPFKLRRQEISGLTSGLKMNDRDTTMSRLVYRVIPLPESLVPFIWDYKSLNRNEEIQYIRKMIEKTFDESLIFGQGLNLVYMWAGDKNQNQKQKSKAQLYVAEIKRIADTVFQAQSIIKEQEDSPWAVSLRDVSRFCKLFVYFYQNNSNQDKRSKPRGPNDQIFGNRDIALVLSLYFCYVIRISEQDKRNSFISKLHKTLGVQANNCINPQNFKTIVNQEQNRFIREMEIKKGIGMSQTLKENIFVIITCILNNIPLIITGKPGSSKTLAMNLITKSFKGLLSSKAFFQQFPSIVPFYYQGSEQTTSKSIEKIYKKAIKAKEKLKDKNSRVVVVFDEIGLAEQSIHNPLKVLHSLLEPPQVAFVGISNWSLDASKMNRVITLSRYDPDQYDLLETALSIARNYNPNYSQKQLIPLVDWYLEYMDKQRRSQQNENFHGLRDFYSLIKYISPRMNSSEENNEKVILKGVQRNFGGLNSNDAISLLDDKLNFKYIEDLYSCKPDQLIIENLLDQESRHLMIITDNFENSLQFIQDQCQKQTREIEILYGSDFPDDQNEDATYEQINEIIFNMESGTLCVFLNLKNVYQSFYDMLNQNYTEIGTQNTQKYSKVAVGADQSLFLVHQNFKCILVVDQNQIKDLDGPLKNRFEKQLYTEEISTTLSHRQIKDEISQWTYQISKVHRFEKKQMFPTIDEKQSYQQLIIQSKDLYGDNDEIIKQECKKSLIRVATFQGIIRSQLSQVVDKNIWYKEYFNQPHHFDLYQLIDHYYNNWKDEKCFQNLSGFNLITYTFSSLLDQKVLKDKYKDKIEDSIELSNIHKKKQFKQLIESYFNKENKNELLLIFADMMVMNITKNIINLCRSKINSERTKRSLLPDSDQLVNKHICFIIKLDFTKESNDHYVSFGKDWRQYMVDLLNGRGHQEITIKQLFDNNIESLIKISSSKKTMFEQALVEGLSKIFYKKPQKFITERLEKIQNIFNQVSNNEFLTELIVCKFQKNPMYDSIMNSWRSDVVCNDFLMKSNLTFHGAALEFIKTELVNHLAFVISYLEQDGIITSYENEDLFEMAKGYFTNLFRNNIINNRFLNVYYLNFNFDRIRFPLARVIHQQFSQLRVQFMKNDKQFDDSKINLYQKSQNDNDFIDLNSIELSLDDLPHERQMSSKQKENQRLIYIKKKEILQKDKHLSRNIDNLNSWCVLYFPKEYINKKMLTENNMQYLEDFSYLINNQESKQFTDSSVDYYKRYLSNSIKYFLKEKIITDKTMSKSKIYGIYWKYENLFLNVWKIIYENQKYKPYIEIEEKLIKEILKNPHYLDTDFKYLPKEAFVESVIKVFFEIYYPSEQVFDFVVWENNVKSTFQRLNDLSFYYQGVTQTQESRVIIFLLRYYQEIIKYGGVKANTNNFIEFAKNIKEIFQMPQLLVQYLLELMEETWLQKKDLELKKRIFKIACEYIIESYQLLENIDFNFLINKVLVLLISNKSELYSLQHKDSYKFTLQSLITIVTSIIRSQNYGVTDKSCFSEIIEGDQVNYDTNVEKYHLVKILNDFVIAYSHSISRSDPLIISLTDQLIDFIKYDPFDHLPRMKNALDHIRHIFMNSNMDHVSLQQLIAVAAFKKIAKIQVQEIEYLSKDDDTMAVDLAVIIDQFFQCDNEQQRISMQPFAIYLMKLLYQKYDFERKDRDFLRPLVGWFDQFQKIDFERDIISFSYIRQSEFNQVYEKFQSQLPVIDESVHKKSPLNKFLQILALIDSFYIQKRKQEVPKNQIDIFAKNQCLTQDPNLQDFLRPFVDQVFDKVPRNMFLRIDDLKGEKYHYKLLSMMIGSAGFANQNLFFYQFFVSPQKMKDSFVPFVQNFIGDSEYQKMFKNNDKLSCLECIHCKRQTLRIELSDYNSASQKTLTHGERRCRHKDPNQSDKVCNNKLINKQEPISSLKNVRSGVESFIIKNTNELAKKSYIPFERESYNQVQIRKLNRYQLATGRILLHCMLMFCLSFCKQDNAMLEIILTDYLYSGKKYEEYLADALKYLSYCINQDWEFLKTVYFLNDEKVSQIIQFIIVEIVKTQNGAYDYEKLRTIDGRKHMEQNFKVISDQIFGDLKMFFTTKVQQSSPLEMYLLENNKLQQNDYYHLLRSINQTSIVHFERFVIEDWRDDTNFFRMLFEQKESIKNLRQLKYLVEWARYIFDKYSTQLTYDEANEMTIQEAMERDFQQNQASREYRKKKQKDFKKFKQAWNTFTGLIIKDKDVEVVIPEISEQSKLMLCCLTKDKKDQLGQVFYILIKYLTQKQDKVLKEAEKLFKEHSVNSIRFPKIQLLNLKQESVIYFREKQKIIDKRERALTAKVSELQENQLEEMQFDEELIDTRQQNLQIQEAKKLEEELFEELIIKNSACSLQYSKGMFVEYDIDKIKTQTIEILLKGKHMIELDDQNSGLNFQFVNLGNLYSQFEAIQKIEPQENLPENISKVILEFRDTEKLHQLIAQLRITMNYIESLDFPSSRDSTSAQQNLELINFMKALQITKEDNILGFDLKLNNLISLYEAIEQKVEENEVKNISVKYHDEMSEAQNIQIGREIHSLEKQQIEDVSHVVGRFCIRYLRNFQKELLNKRLFEHLLENKNLFQSYITISKQKNRKESQESEVLDYEQNNKIKDIVNIIKRLMSVDLEIRHAKALYDRLRQQYLQKQDEEKNKAESIAKERQELLNAEQVKNIDYNQILMMEQQKPQATGGRRNRGQLL